MNSRRVVTVVVAGALASLGLVLTGGVAGAQPNNDGTPAPPGSVSASGDVSAAGTGNVALFFDDDYVDIDAGAAVRPRTCASC